MADVREQARRWCRDVAGLRIRGATRRKPLVVFQDEEREALIPWGGETYEIADWREAKVRQDHHIQCRQALYSVPSSLCPQGQKVEVRVDSKLVHICRPSAGSGVGVDADDYFRVMNQARVDNSLERTFRSFLTPDLLILDDLGLHRFTAQQSADLYELVLNRHRASSFVITSNRAVDEWLGLFEDPIPGNSALDRLANASYQIVIEGSSYRERLSPHRALLEAIGVIDQPTAT